MKKIISMLFLMNCVAVIIVSCAKKDDSSTTTTTTELEGTWITSCTLDSDNYSHLYKVVVTGTDIVETDEIHSDTSCATDVRKWEYTYSSLTIGDEITFTDQTKGHRYTVDIQSIKYAEQTSSGISTLNSGSICGYNDWALNTLKDITGDTCGSTTYAAKNTTARGLYNLVGNNLFSGGIITTGSYPTEVSTSITFVKQ